VTILILEYACILHASSSMPPYKEALEKACSQYTMSDAHNALRVQFPLSQVYSISQVTDFILKYHL
jgi:hypothetical protein